MVRSGLEKSAMVGISELQAWAVISASNYSPPLRRSTSLRRSAAAMTAGACSRPGCRDSRSIGPDTLTAAMTLPEGERTGADTDATPGSRSPTECAQPRRRTAASATAEDVTGGLLHGQDQPPQQPT